MILNRDSQHVPELKVGVLTKEIEFNNTVRGEYFVASDSPNECLE